MYPICKNCGGIMPGYGFTLDHITTCHCDNPQRKMTELEEIKAERDNLICVISSMIDEMSKTRSYKKIGHSWKQLFLQNLTDIPVELREELGMEKS